MRIKLKLKLNDVISLFEKLYTENVLKEKNMLSNDICVMVYQGTFNEPVKKARFSLFIVNHNEYVEVSCSAHESKLKISLMKNKDFKSIIEEDFKEKLQLNNIEYEVINNEE